MASLSPTDIDVDLRQAIDLLASPATQKDYYRSLQDGSGIHNRVLLTVAVHEGSGIADSVNEHFGRLLDSLGGEVDPQVVRRYLSERSAVRERSASRFPREPDADSEWQRRAACECGPETIQLRHGYTGSGGLWKGHRCLCGGFECTECGRVNERGGLCCR